MTKDKFWEVINNARAIAPALEGEPLRESLYKQLLTLFPEMCIRDSALALGAEERRDKLR